jgi:hypothetical protein
MGVNVGGNAFVQRASPAAKKRVRINSFMDWNPDSGKQYAVQPASTIAQQRRKANI